MTEATSTHLVIAVVQLAKREPLPELSVARRLLYLPLTYEFKYHQARPHQKNVFFEQVKYLPFRIRAVVIEKAVIRPKYHMLSGTELLNEFTTQLIVRSSELDIIDDILIIDGAVPSLIQDLRVRLSGVCRQEGRRRPFKKIVSADSDREDGLQLADMVAGAIMQFTKGVDVEFYQTFATKVVDLWEVKG